MAPLKADLARGLDEHALWLSSAGNMGRQLFLSEVDLREVDLSRRDLREAYLGGCQLDGATLIGTDLSGSTLTAASLVETNLEGARLVKAELDHARARSARFKGADLTRCSFVGADLRGAAFDGATVRQTVFVRADLRGCTMRQVQMERVSFDQAVFGAFDPAGATGTLLPGTATIDDAGEIRTAVTDQLIAWLCASGAGALSVFWPPAPRSHGDPPDGGMTNPRAAGDD